jgi:hypothetical protein
MVHRQTLHANMGWLQFCIGLLGEGIGDVLPGGESYATAADIKFPRSVTGLESILTTAGAACQQETTGPILLA